MIRVSIYDDDEKLRSLLVLLIKSDPDMEVVGDYMNCQHVTTDLVNDKPDVMVLDIDMPTVNGIQGIERIKSHAPQIRVLMHTAYQDDDRLFSCISAGADGYLLKKDSPVQLIEAIKEIHRGGSPMTPSIARKILETFRQNTAPINDYEISMRERQILELLAKGNSYRMIGIECSISSETVRRHLQSVYTKLHVKCGTEAVAKAIRERIILA